MYEFSNCYVKRKVIFTLNEKLGDKRGKIHANKPILLIKYLIFQFFFENFFHFMG